MSNSGRIAVIAVVAFGAAFLLSGNGNDEATDTATDVGAGATTTSAPSSEAPEVATNPCVAEEVVAATDAGYEITVVSEPDPPVSQGTTIEVSVQREGAPVSGAIVCLSADMSDMSHAGVNAQADELGEGRYRMPVEFGMRGGWSGGVLVIESGRGASTPVSFNVQ